ncbi:hypothetical protein EMCRGX_G017500 [Ephydatia muelleri]
MLKKHILLCICSVVISGVSSFTLTPINTTVCSGSTLQFVCSATDVTTVSYSLNSKPIPPLPPNIIISAPTFIGEMRIVNMSISNASANAVITCRAYLVNGTVWTRTAYLIVQGPSSAPTDLNIITYNDTATLLVWGPPPDAQSPSLLSYAVVIRNGSGAPVYSETVREPQLVITTPDPCSHYEATVTPMCGSITGVQTSPVEMGDPPTIISHVYTSFWYHPLSPSDNVTVNISVPFYSKVCFYKMVALSAYEMLSFPSMKPLPSLYKDQSTITVSLPPNKHFNLTITAYNGYGNTSTTVVITTFDVVGVSVNSSSPMELVCLFNTGSPARGCLVYLTDTDTGVTCCRVVWRSLDTPANMSLCTSCNGPLSTGVYSVEVYDIERDWSVSSVPALAGEIVTVFGPSTVFRRSTVFGPSTITYDSPPIRSSCVSGLSTLPTVDSGCSPILAYGNEAMLRNGNEESAASLYENTCIHQRSIQLEDRMKSKVSKLSGSVAFKNSNCVRIVSGPYPSSSQALEKAEHNVLVLKDHRKPENAFSEINNLHTAFLAASDHYGTQRGIILGDFNAGCSYLSAKKYRQLSLVTDTSFTWLLDQNTYTNVKMSCPYDRIVTHRSILPMIDKQPVNQFRHEGTYFTGKDDVRYSCDAANPVPLHPAGQQLRWIQLLRVAQQ